MSSIQNKKYWIDSDAGVDDAIAILWAIREGFSIVGISAVAGNLNIDGSVRNLCALVEYEKKDIPVYFGASNSFIGNRIDASHIHGVNLGPITLDKTYQAKSHVFEGLLDFFRNTNEKLNIVTLGPLTNIASFLIHYPEYKDRIALYVMGGGTFGNITAYGEFNFYCDVEAAHFIFSQNLDIVLSDLDITDHHAYFTKEDMEKYVAGRNIDDWASRLMYFRIEKSALPHAARIYDVLPFVYIKYPELFETNEVFVEVELAGKMRGFSAYDYEGMRRTNFLFPEKNIKKVKRLICIDKNVYTKTILDTFIK